ncbi:MAG: AMP-binding protein [Ilumatobacteraceae bacterium]
MLVTRADLLAQVDEVAGELTDLARIITIDSAPVARLGGRPVIAWDELAAQGGVAPERPAPSTADIASLLFTSGTTGPSKGVLVRWGQITVGSELSPLATFGDDAATYSPYPVYHLSGKIPLVAMARVRGRVVTVEKYSTTRLWDDIAAYRCTSLGLIGALAQFVTSVELRPDQIGHLRYVTMSPCLPTVDEIAARLQVAVGTAYGSTEAGWPLLNRCATAADHLSCGRLREGYELRIVDERDRDVAVGQVGELLVRSTVPQLMSAGYFELPDKTAEAWRGGWFHTGDAFRRDDEGRYYFLDRTKDAIRRRGENISSFEVETYVEQHPQIERCAAIAVPAEVGEDEVKVCVVPVAGATLDPSSLRGWLEARMPRFMVPRYVEVVDDLPLTDTGKVKKAELRAVGVNATTFDADRRAAPA